MQVRIKRVYEPAAKDDGFRVLVDRLWPRGVTKAEAQIGLWAKGIAPSTRLRQWFGHDPDRWTEFQKRYKEELRASDARDELKRVIDEAKGHKTVTLLYGAKDAERNQAVVLKALFEKKTG
jgi:uncharacterized protein YeaO (DUF488 family)